MSVELPEVTSGLERLKQPGKDACGIVAIAELNNSASSELVDLALSAIACMEHRGGCIEETGDGAGILLRPERSFFDRFITSGMRLEEGELLIVGCAYLLRGERNVKQLQREVDLVLRRQGLKPLGWRKVAVNPQVLGTKAREDLPQIYQILIGRGHRLESQLPEILAFVRRHVEDTMPEVRLPSLAAHTTVYKALATGDQLAKFYEDFSTGELKTRVVLGHRRFSTNTFSNWHLAQPFRLLAHNGEINTIRANTRAVRDVQSSLGAQKVLAPRGSDSAQLDRTVELIASSQANGLAEAMRRMLPPSWREEESDPRKMRFYEASQRVMETLGAWEGPAALIATDGKQLVGMLDRMGLRPLRWIKQKSGRIVISSEIGAVPCLPEEIERDGQLEPGAMLIADLASGELVLPEDSTDWIFSRANQELRFGDLSTTELLASQAAKESDELSVRAQNRFGWTREKVQTLRKMCKNGKEPVHSMGNDRPLAIFSENNSRLYSFLSQIVAVVTNPAIDPLREGEAMDLTVFIGSSPRLHADGTYRVSRQYKLPHPILSNEDVTAIKSERNAELKSYVLDATFTDNGDPEVISDRIQELIVESEEVVASGVATILILSDRAAAGEGEGRYPLPILLAASAIHRHLSGTQNSLRRSCSLVIETAEVHEGHDLAVLIAYGATAVNPYAMFELAQSTPKLAPEVARENLLKALVGSLRRIMSKMGIPSIFGYRGSSLFEAVGISPQVVDYYLPGTTALVGGITMNDIYADVLARGKDDEKLAKNKNVSVYRKEVTNALQMVARNADDKGDYAKMVKLLDETPPVYLRDLLRLTPAEKPLPLDRVVASQDVIRSCFRGAAMSHGAMQATAHRAIASAFNSFGAMSNSGEGGEDERRNPGGEWEEDRNRVRQVASGRFGVDATYLVGADELQIKIGQGAKPGEGGHLPGHKVTAEIAAIRKTRTGIDLISPPPHHDIYSIEDLAQLIRHLREVNPDASIGVKVPAVTDLGTIVVGVAKAGADTITISGSTGGTGAAASGSIFHAGLPLERGLSEAHQALVINGIRERIKIVADGGVKYGVDVALILALGADMVGFGTALLVAENCVFCRGCNAGNCPVGLTTHDQSKVFQRFMTRHNDELKKTAIDQRYMEAREGVRRYLLSVAEHTRRILADTGLTHPRQLVGRVDLVKQITTGNPRWDSIDLSEILLDPRSDATRPAHGPERFAQRSTSPTNEKIVKAAKTLSESDIDIDLGELGHSNHAVGATLAGQLSKGTVTRPADSPIRISAKGMAGQGFGFAARAGMSLRLEGYANDVVGEVMSEGAQIVITQPKGRHDEDVPHLIGNAAAYGATGGKLYVAGRAGQRFGVRNSGALLVAEGVGKYAFEYMTGGIGVVLGSVGHAFGSGLTGGELAVFDPNNQLKEKLNKDAVVWKDVPASRSDDLFKVVTDFVKETGSKRAKQLLTDWDAQSKHFVWVRSIMSEGVAVGDAESEAEEWPS